MNQDLFAGRFQFLQEAPAGSGGRLFEARDIQSGQIVALKVFRRELEDDAPEREDLQRLFNAARDCTHPGLVRYHTISMDEGFIVREWVHGFGLIDLLRRRREIPAEELVILFDGVAEALDLSDSLGLGPVGNLITRIFIGWDRSIGADELARLRGVPIDEWSGFTVKLNPLCMSHVLPMAWDETMNTISGDGLPIASMAGLPTAFTETVYELLGAPHRGARGRRYVPISTLSEGGNGVLRQIITGPTKPTSCATIWTQLLEASDLRRPDPRPVAPPPPPPVPVVPARPAPAPPPPPPKRALSIPEPFLTSFHSGTVLRLTPRDVSFSPIHLFARPAFRIGRSLYHADFITRILPETAENEKLTKELGRVHILAEQREGRIYLRDGNGEHASVNGSQLDGVALAHDKPTLLERKGVLALYRNYQLEIVPLLGSYDRGCEITNESDWPGTQGTPPPLNGAVAFLPMHQQPALRQAAWIFTRLDFSLTPRGDIVWVEAGTPASQGSFLHHRGQFWLANFALPAGSLSIAHHEIGVGSIVPLVPNQSIALGPGNYVVEVQ